MNKLKLIVIASLIAISYDAYAAKPTEPKPKSITLGDLACTTDQIAKFDGNNWACSSNAALEAQMADLLARVAVAEAALATNTSNIATNASFIATNSSDILATGPHYTDNDAVEAIGPHYDDTQAIAAVGPHSPDLTADVSANTAAIEAVGPHYTDAEAIAAAGPHFSGSHADLTNVIANQHHVPNVSDLTDIEAAIAYYDDLLDGIERLNDPYTLKDTLRFSSMNLQVVSGSGSTRGLVNGTGNLIIGYNEPNPVYGDDRTGSHMLVIGEGNNYSSYGGMVVGAYNTTSDRFASVSGGYINTASGEFASVSGGNLNTASGYYASVSGGWARDAVGPACTEGDSGTNC